MGKLIWIATLLLLTFALVACGGQAAVPEASGEPTMAPALEPTIPPTPPSNSEPTEDAPTPSNTPTVVALVIPPPLFYNLPPTELTNATGLYASPNRSDLIVPVPIPSGETVYIMGRNATNSHLRVVWNTGVGWIPVSFTTYNGQRDRLAALPVFEREPPSCAVPITTQFNLNSEWTSEAKQRIAVIIDLFRSKFGAFPNSSISLTVNGQEVADSRRSIVERGQFSLKDVVFTLPRDVQPGDRLGYLLNTTSDEPLTFLATIFSVPQNCQWKLD